MGYSALATINYGYDVTNQSPAWFDNDDMDDFGEYGSRMLAAAKPGTKITLQHYDSGIMILSAFGESVWQGQVSEFNAPNTSRFAWQLAWAAKTLDFDISSLQPMWHLHAQLI